MRNEVQIEKGMSTGLALFSLGLGAVELIAPRWLARTIGIDVSPGMMRTFGLREIASGITMLAQPGSPRGARSRLAGDAMDLALLASAGRTAESSGAGRVVAIAAVLGVAAMDLYASAEPPPLTTH